MIGLVRKDLYMLFGAYKKNMLLVFALYGALTLGIKQTFFLSWTIWMTGLYSLSAITMDDSSGWDRYARTLPVSCGKIVGARFLSALVMLGIGAAFSALLCAALCVFQRYADVWELVLVIAVTAGLILVMLGVIFPAAYKWGVDKARNGFLLVFVLVFVGPVLFRDSQLARVGLRTVKGYLEGVSAGALCGAALGTGLLVFAFGGWLSWRIYRKKEF